MKLLEEMASLYNRGISVELSGETSSYAMIEARRGRTNEWRLVPGDIPEDDLINFIESDLVKVVKEKTTF